MTAFRTYRDTNTDVEREYPVPLASRFPNLIEVQEPTEAAVLQTIIEPIAIETLGLLAGEGTHSEIED